MKENDDERGFFKVVKLGDWNAKFFRGYVGQSFNKLTNGAHDLWPQELSKASIYEFILFEKGHQYLLKMTSITSEAYLNSTLVYLEQGQSSSSLTREEMDMGHFVEKFRQLLGTVFVQPYPKGLPKDLIYQTEKVLTAQAADPSAGKDLDII